MKSSRRVMRLITFFLTFLMLFQSCRVYHKEHVTLDKAVEEGKRVKIVSKNGFKFKYKAIVIDDGQYYGVKKINGKFTRTLIDANSIESLRLHDKTMSIIYGTGIGLIISGVVLTVIFITTWNGPNFDFAPTSFPN
ncbi:MAG: hypothetical protein ACX93I_02685 [Winogradskyella sp.]